MCRASARHHAARRGKRETVFIRALRAHRDGHVQLHVDDRKQWRQQRRLRRDVRAQRLFIVWVAQVNAAVMTSVPTPREACGSHVLADLGGIAVELLRDATALETILVHAAGAAGARVLSAHFHQFGGEQGVTGVVLLAESHITLHTWPEHRFAALDIFMCGNARPEDAVERIARDLQAEVKNVRVCERGFTPAR
jgi:S-adenosylmethionine decarboxylase